MEFRQPRGNMFGKETMSKEEINQFLADHHCASLAFENINGYPGVTPVNYAWDGQRFYIHCARKGERYESLQKNVKVALNVYVDTNDESDEEGMAEHRSVTAYGEVKKLEGKDALEALDLLAYQAHKPFKAGLERNEKFLPILDLYAVEPVHITGRKIPWRSQPKK